MRGMSSNGTENRRNSISFSFLLGSGHSPDNGEAMHVSDDDAYDKGYKNHQRPCRESKPGEKRRDGNGSGHDARYNHPTASHPIRWIPHFRVLKRLSDAKTVKSVGRHLAHA